MRTLREYSQRAESLTHSLANSLIPSQSLTLTVTHSLSKEGERCSCPSSSSVVNSLTRSPHSPTHSLTHSPTHSTYFSTYSHNAILRRPLLATITVLCYPLPGLLQICNPSLITHIPISPYMSSTVSLFNELASTIAYCYFRSKIKAFGRTFS